MKKFYPPLVIILTLLLIIVSCKSFSNSDNLTPITSNEMLNEHLITSERALQIKNKYDSFRLNFLEEKLKTAYNNGEFQDTEFVWFSLETMKAYIKYIEAIKKKNPKEKVSGIRVYFAAYPNDKSTEKYPGNQTTFMVPTINTNFNDPDFDIINHLPFEINPKNPNNPLEGDYVILDDLMLDYKKSVRTKKYLIKSNVSKQNRTALNNVNAANTNNTTSTILNEGDLAPPPR